MQVSTMTQEQAIRKKKVYLWTLGTFIAASVLGTLAIGIFLSEMLLYPFSGIDHTKGRCRNWHHEKSFVQYDNPKIPVDEPCEIARDRPFISTFVTNTLGKKIHLRTFNNLPSEARSNRAWLHIHGITSTGLDGARYYHAANRLGFNLFAMDLSNHGLSEDDGRGAAYGCREYHDVLAIMKYLLNTYPDYEFLITASSMGAMALINSSKELFALPGAARIRAFGIENPATSVREIAFRGRGVPPAPKLFLDVALWVAKIRMGCDFDHMQPIDNAQYISVPTWFVHSKQDEILPPEFAQELAANMPKQIPHVVSIRERGWHSAIWNENPQQFEQELAAIFDTGLNFSQTKP